MATPPILWQRPLPGYVHTLGKRAELGDFMTNWNFAQIFAAVAARVPDRPCQIQGERVITWREFDAPGGRARRRPARAAACSHQSKVACYLYNAPEYLEAMTPRSRPRWCRSTPTTATAPEEIVYLFDNADAEAVVFHAAFTELLERVRDRLPQVKRWYVVADETGAGPDWATPYEAVVDRRCRVSRRTPWGRSGDDLLLLYTGGTTGMPKGVMWRQDDLFNVLGAGGNALARHRRRPRASTSSSAGSTPSAPVGPVMLVACPLMHGTGQFSALNNLANGGCVVVARQSQVRRRRAAVDQSSGAEANSIIIVGQAFAGPMLDHLDINPDRYDLSVVLDHVEWRDVEPGEQGRSARAHAAGDPVRLVRIVGGRRHGRLVRAPRGRRSRRREFRLGPNCAVFTDDGERVEPGSGEQGMVAVGGFIPLGYYKDEAKTRADVPHRTRVGVGACPGDWAEVNDDGTLHLLGRGSVCINTGGEKVFPEEVEEALKTHPTVRDAVCVGLPDARFGEVICAVVEAEAGDGARSGDAGRLT